MKNPCRECERQGCGSFHDECPKYQKWVEERKAANARRSADIEQTAYIIAARVRIRGKKRS